MPKDDALYTARARLLRDNPEEYFRRYPRPRFNPETGTQSRGETMPQSATRNFLQPLRDGIYRVVGAVKRNPRTGRYVTQPQPAKEPPPTPEPENNPTRARVYKRGDGKWVADMPSRNAAYICPTFREAIELAHKPIWDPTRATLKMTFTYPATFVHFPCTTF